jgi:HEAT repeat protein
MLRCKFHKLKSTDSLKRRRAVEQLAHLKNPKVVEHLIPMLKDTDVDVRRAAIKSLGNLGDKRAIKGLINSLIDVDQHAQFSIQNEYTRKLAAEALQKLSWEPENFTEWVNLLFARQEYSTVVQIGKDAVKPLINLLPIYGATAVKTLCEINSPEVLTPVLKYVKDAAGDVIVRELSCVRNLTAIKALIELLLSKDYRTRELAQESLVKYGDSAVELLISALNHQNWYMRQASASVLGSIGNPKAAQPLADALIKTHMSEPKIIEDGEYERASIVNAMFALGKASVVPIIEILKKGDSQLQDTSLRLLREFGDRSAIPAVKDFLSSGHEYLKREAELTLMKLESN